MAHTLTSLIGWWFSQRATFYLVPLFALMTIAVLMSIPGAAIDHDRARGFAPGQHGDAPRSAWRVLTGTGLLCCWR